MPHIEVLPTTSKAAAPGWSYVVDTGYDPSKAAINPTSRKRARFAHAGPSASDLSIRQQTAISRHLEELDKDSHKAVNISVPVSRNAGAAKGRKQTVNTRRILASGKDFGHYLDVEEALVAKGGGLPGVPGAMGDAEVEAPKSVQRASKTPIARRKPQPVVVVESTPVPVTTATTPGPATAAAPTAQKIPKSLEGVFASQQEAREKDGGLLVHKTVVQRATVAEVEQLLAAQPLGYNAARSAPSTGPPDTAPRRVFCEICGYWGRVRCLKCGGRVCGLECKGVHDESRCVRF